MRYPSSSLGLAAVLGALAVVTPGLAVHNGPDLNEDEVQCQLRSQYVMASFARRYTKCLSARRAPGRTRSPRPRVRR